MEVKQKTALHNHDLFSEIMLFIMTSLFLNSSLYYHNLLYSKILSLFLVSPFELYGTIHSDHL
jgi:hypothetical protein